MKSSRMTTGAAVAIFLLALVACEKKEPTLGERVDAAAESVSDAAEEAGEAVSDAADDASDALSEAAEDAEEKVNN